jgi:hypothetical protein
MIQDKIPTGQFAVFQTDAWTGVPLDENGKWVKGDTAYLIVVGDKETGTKIAQERVAENHLAEWWIMDHSGQTYGPFRDEDALSKESKRRKAK